MLLRPGNAGCNTAADHLTVIRDALRQLPFPTTGRVGRKVLIRTDAAGCTHQFVDWLTARRLSYSLGFTLPRTSWHRIATDPRRGVDPGVRRRRHPRDGAWVAEAHRRARPVRVAARDAGHRPRRTTAPRRPTAVHRRDGNRLTAFATNTSRGQLADLELRHRRRARCEDRIRGAKDTGLTNLPLHDFTQNQIWLAIVALALDLTAWMQLLGVPRRTRRGAGNPNGSGCGSSPSPAGSPATPDRSGCTCRGTHPGGTSSSPPSAASTHHPPPPDHPTPDPHHPRTRGTRRPPRRHRGHHRTPRTRKETTKRS